jgi:hypothetical protein
MENIVDLIILFINGVIIIDGNNSCYSIRNNRLIIVDDWLKGGIR